MLPHWVVIVAAFGYIGLLFAIASYGDRVSGEPRSRAGVLIYPLSLAIYCTSWTFFGSVGLASRNGIEFLAIYAGPVLMVGLGTPLLMRVVRLAKTHNITSIADFIAARYGKSQAVAATVAMIALIGSIPYIALQLKAVASSLETVMGTPGAVQPVIGDMALIVTFAMAMFAVLFGTRHTDATEHQNGLILAIATESIVKLFAFLAVGAFVTFWMFSPVELLQRATESAEARQALEYAPSWGNFAVMTLLAFFAILLLPRQFHVSVVENTSDIEVRRARWLFPIYLIAINLFVIPIALAGLIVFPTGGVDSDMFVLALPLAGGSPLLTVAVFIGGLSAATAMVIVECVALAIMVSNHIVMPLVLQRSTASPADSQNVGSLLLKIRRVAIFGILLLAYFYYRQSGVAQLASIGLLSFAAVAQFAPAFFGGLFWRRGTALGALAGMIIGFLVWAYTLFLPSFADAALIGAEVLTQGPFGIAALKPQALFGLDLPPLMHGVFWSLMLNVIAYVVVSLARQPTSIEHLQADLFVPPRLAPAAPNFRRWRSTVTVEDLMNTVGQYLGPDRTRASFEAFANANRIALERGTPADFQLLRHAEHLIASAIGVASARLVLSLLLRKRTVSGKAALKLLDDAHAALHYNQEILQTALNHVRQGIAVFNSEHQLICSNRQFGEILDLPPRILEVGITLEEILETIKPKVTHQPGDDASFVATRVAAYTTEGMPHLERFADRNLVVEVRANRMPDGVVVTFSDITQSVEAAEALERANATLERRVHERTEELTRLNSELARAKGEADAANLSKTRFLAAAGHDLLQPLNAARLYVTSLVERQIGGEDARLVANIDGSLEQIEQLLGALLDISRLDAGALKPSLTSFRVSDVLRTLRVEFAPIARAKGLELTFVLSSQPIHSDKTMLLRLLQNLVSNAIKYTPKGKVLVGCRRRGQSLQIDVYDTGIGIPVSKRKEIFKEFHRLDQGARIARGLGLGLSIVQRMARVLGHGLALDSNRSGGSHFSVTVPTTEIVTHASTIANVISASRTPLQGALIVVIENEPAILDGMRTLITGWGADVIALPDAVSAMQAIQRDGRTPTGLVVDYHLDRGHGIAAIGDLREKYGADIPAILITADRSPKVREAARAAQISLLNKPVKPASLRAIIGQWCKQRLVAAE
ncbi:hybrid sensor histidine kinase/response regulator [Bradyrhizobium sp. LHD-71]|uniref:PAS domain-containing hybrid sensor histidine kinase/response regulator n=1 Tax=Bradyrhizobium sp. LHD-71 TaxID=3072141 RepID=UPI00280E2F86|nr:hybrid sensor histidine kinase/response regulator [Bradyrhizobium sp. LHD-71]MDQ8730408.1 hybrid sensor histidine kinase/response regulator [Bradyrhizobium sp. LHD-71]